MLGSFISSQSLQSKLLRKRKYAIFLGAMTQLQAYSCSTASAENNLLWDMEPEVVREHLQQRDLLDIKAHLTKDQSQQIMRDARLIGTDSLYTIALIFAEKKEWDLYQRAMMVQSYSGSKYGQEIALQHMAQHKIFSDDQRLNSLQQHLKKQNRDGKHLIQAATLALDKGKVDLARDFWVQFISSRRTPATELSLDQVIIGLKLALLQRDQLSANYYMRKVVLGFSADTAHEDLLQDLNIRPEWRELLHASQEGPPLLQSLEWKVNLLQKKFSQTLPQLLNSGAHLDGKEQLSEPLSFWWTHPVLVEDTGRALFNANKYRSQSRNVKDGRRRFQSLIGGQTSLAFDRKTYNNLIYWYIRNNRNYPEMEKYRAEFRGDDSLRPWLLTEYLYFFKNADHWTDFPAFLASWRREQPDKLSLNSSSIRIFRQIYRDMSARKKRDLLQKMFREARRWGQEELILESAWNYRLVKGQSLSTKEWLLIPRSRRSRVISDIRLFVLRADQGENMLPPLREREPEVPLNPAQQALEELLRSLIDHGFNDEALRLARIYHQDLSPSSIVDFARRIQAQGDYDIGMRMVAQLTYDENYNMSREALKLFYPKVYYNLINSFSEEYSLPISIFYGLIRQESYFSPAVVSHAGAIGLSQLMPATMHEVARKIGFRDPDATDPATNLKIGSYYLRYLIDHRWTNNLAQALMAYNAGLGNIRKWKARLGSLSGLEFNNSVPLRETRLYVQKIGAGAIYYAILYNWRDPISVLHTIYPQDFPNAQAKTQARAQQMLKLTEYPHEQSILAQR